MSEVFLEKFKSLVPTYLGEPWNEADGVRPDELDELLAVPVPLALREFYLAVGASELMEAGYFVWDPEELELDEGYLLFMEDEGETFTWGFAPGAADLVDPIVWRRKTGGEWVSEEGTFSEFMTDMFEGALT